MKVPNIRFSLKFFDENGFEIAIRTIEDLRSNCNVYDLYSYMVNGTLTRWLLCLHEDKCAESIERVRKEEHLLLQVRDMLEALGIEIKQDDINAIVASLEHTDMRKQVEVDHRPDYSELFMRLIRYKYNLVETRITFRKMLDYYFNLVIRDIEQLRKLPCVCIVANLEVEGHELRALSALFPLKVSDSRVLGANAFYVNECEIKGELATYLEVVRVDVAGERETVGRIRTAWMTGDWEYYAVVVAREFEHNHTMGGINK